MNKHQILENIVSEAKGGLQFCEWIIEHSYMPKREILQTYMVWKFKYDSGIIDQNEAFKNYVNEGWALRFAEIYHEDIDAHEMYVRLFKIEEPDEFERGYN